MPKDQKQPQQPLNRHYVSTLDRFLMNFDKKPEASSCSRRAEEANYDRINRLRDVAETDETEKQVWEGFYQK